MKHSARYYAIRAVVRVGFALAVILLVCAVIGWALSWVGFFGWAVAFGSCLAVLATLAWASESLNPGD